MNDQSQTAANAPSEPRLCKMGCGFFVSRLSAHAACLGCFRLTMFGLL